MSIARKIVSGFIGGITLTTVGLVASFIQFSLLLRYLPLEVVGIWMVFTSIGAYVMFFDLGMSPTLGREISFAAGDLELDEVARANRIGTLIRSCTTIVAVLAVAMFLIGISGGWSYLSTVVPRSLRVEVYPAWIIFAAGAALNLIGEGWFAGIYGLGQVFSEKIIRSLGAVLGLIFVSIAVLRHSFMGLATAYLLQAGCTISIARYVLFRAGPRTIARGQFQLSTIRMIVGPSLKYAATLLGGILILQTDNLVIASILGPKLIPNYQAIAKMVSIMMQLSMMLVMTSLPLASQAYARNDTPQLLRLLNRNLRYSLSVMVILGSFVACFADRVILVWLGPNHFVGFAIVWVLLTVMLLEAHHQSMAAAIMATGKIVFVVPALLAGVLNIIFSILLARRYGLIGVVFGTMLAQVATNNWYAPWYTLRYFRISFREHFRTVLVPIVGLLTTLVIANLGIRFLTTNIPLILSVFAGALCTGIVGLSVFGIIVLAPEERRRLIGTLRALRLSKVTVPSDMQL
jgi:O-antigen/teichoic acid export membrane protein